VEIFIRPIRLFYVCFLYLTNQPVGTVPFIKIKTEIQQNMKKRRKKTLAGPEYTYLIINIFLVLSFYNELVYQV